MAGAQGLRFNEVKTRIVHLAEFSEPNLVTDCYWVAGMARPAIWLNAGMPRWTLAGLCSERVSSWASLFLAPARLICSPSISPSHPSRLASIMRASRLSRISSRRACWAGSGLSRGHLTQACSWMHGEFIVRAQVPTDSFRRSKCARNASHSALVGVRYSSLGLAARRRAMNDRWASSASVGRSLCSPWWLLWRHARR